MARGILPFRLDSVWLRTGWTEYKDLWFRTNIGQLKWTRLSAVARLVSLVHHKWKLSLVSPYLFPIMPQFDDPTRPLITPQPLLSHELVNVWIMSGSQQKPRSNNPNAPNISYDMYLFEKSGLAGLFIGLMLYGTPKTSPPTCLTIRSHSVCSVYSRGRRRGCL